MSLAAALIVVAAASAGTPPAHPAREQPRPAAGVELETARVSATILRPAMLRQGTLVGSSGEFQSARSQRRAEGTRVVYIFE